MTVKGIYTFLVKDNGWKSNAINALVSAVVLALLNSFLFDLAIGLIKVCLIAGMVGFTVRAAYLAYPLLEKEIKKRSS